MVSHISVLVLNWNGKRWLNDCLAALLAQEGVDFDAWLVDNGSVDGSAAWVRDHFPTVRVLQFGTNLGFGAAYNRAIAQTGSPFVVLLNNDTVVQSGWLAALADDIGRHPEAAAVGSKLLFLNHPFAVNHAGGCLTVLGAAFDRGFGAEDERVHQASRITGCASAAALILRRATFLEVGGFDETYFAYFEDADLCWRYWLRGLEVRYQPEARVFHAYGGSGSGARSSTFRLQHCQTNRLQNMMKHLEMRNLLALQPASAAYDALRVLDFARRGHMAGVRAIVRGTRRYVALLPDALARRESVQRTRLRTDGELIRTGVLAGLFSATTEWRRLNRLVMPISSR